MASFGALPITLRKVKKTYGQVCALDCDELNIQAGEFLTLLGPSGSGKTTLLMILAGFIRPDCGSVCFGEKEMILTPPHRRHVGMVFQNYALFPHMDVGANIAYPLKLRGVDKAEIERRVEDALSTMQLAGYACRRINQLSGGQRQRVALARAIVFEPRILLMDEPLSALDKKLREQMQTELRQLHEKLGMTTVYVTHDQREALTMSDRIAVINGGELVQLDTPKRIYDRPVNAFVADFIGESTLLPAQVIDGEPMCLGRRLQINEEPPADGDYWLLIRPERLSVAATDVESHNIFSGTVRYAVYQGESALLHVSLADGVEARARTAEIRPAGEAITLCLRREHATLVPREDSP